MELYKKSIIMIMIMIMIIIIKFNFFLRTSVWLRSSVNAILLTSGPDLKS